MFTREGYEFVEWTLDEEGLIPFTLELTNLPAENIYVYAQWGEVLGDDDEDIPQTSDNSSRSLAFFLLILGLLATAFVKKEEELE